MTFANTVNCILVTLGGPLCLYHAKSDLSTPLIFIAFLMSIMTHLLRVILQCQIFLLANIPSPDYLWVFIEVLGISYLQKSNPDPQGYNLGIGFSLCSLLEKIVVLVYQPQLDLFMGIQTLQILLNAICLVNFTQIYGTSVGILFKVLLEFKPEYAMLSGLALLKFKKFI